MRLSRIFPFTIFVIAALLLASLAHAESVVWNQTYITRLCGAAGDAGAPADGGFPGGRRAQSFCKWFKADNPNVSVLFGASVINEATG